MEKIKDFINELPQMLRDEAANVLLESDIGYIEVMTEDEIGIDVGVTVGEKYYLYNFDYTELPAGMPMWSELRQKQRIREELAILKQTLQQGKTEITDGAFRFVVETVIKKILG